MNIPNAPYTFDGPYSGCYANRAMCVDERHVFVINEILRQWEFENPLEIGAYNGASTTAFVDAINRKPAMSAVICEIWPTESLLSVVRNAFAIYRPAIWEMPSWDALSKSNEFDFIFIDANHDLESVSKELVHLVHRKPLCVMAHDTSATESGYPRAEGAALLKQTFESMPEYHCIEDCEDRDGEETKRGLFLATTDPALFAVAQKAFEKYGCLKAVMA